MLIALSKVVVDIEKATRLSWLRRMEQRPALSGQATARRTSPILRWTNFTIVAIESVIYDTQLQQTWGGADDEIQLQVSASLAVDAMIGWKMSTKIPVVDSPRRAGPFLGIAFSEHVGCP
ncbi:uncharacterized protein ColSpa_03498 [Colletotrichum spaethianum]|uniref:Uncharacterized protein n=1 Tax=Colletotrichum spaethianum TaxID=700344 RepID=A0AA37LFN8_9PEZI|nr:uncharacterized protein ColSpa_03498 [Colletotrichum spaethianum]GKT43317.1 hypothetical protein ColSpa_03498 [Colletotrichum spaethianum]